MLGNLWSKLRDVVWPRMGLRRYSSYLRHRLLRLSATPHSIAAGVASGAAVSMFPLVGLHFLLGFVLAFFTRGNMIAAAIGTAWGNPFTFPFFFAAAYASGDWILSGGSSSGDASAVAAASGAQIHQGIFSEGFAAIWPAFSRMMVGAVPISILVFCSFYVIVRVLVTRLRALRQARIASRRAQPQPH